MDTQGLFAALKHAVGISTQAIIHVPNTAGMLGIRTIECARRRTDESRPVTCPIYAGRAGIDDIKVGSPKSNPNRRSFRCCSHPPPGVALEQLHHDTLVRRVQILDNDKRHAALRRRILQEQFQRL